MPDPDPDRQHHLQAGLFPALLKHWRRQRGLSQLDLALAADVSARHISFLETGRSNPSPEMVLLMGATLSVPLRQVNAMLVAAGHEPAYPEDQGLPERVAEAVSMLKAHHEPYPLIVVDRLYRIRDLNGGAWRLLTKLLGFDGGNHPPDPATIAELDLNLALLTFDPNGASRLILNFDEVGRQLLWRIQREVLADPQDGELSELLDQLLAMPTIEPDWRQVDLTANSDPALVVHLQGPGVELRFLTTVTGFQAPQNVIVDQLRIETWLPYDEATMAACREMANEPVPPGTLS